MAYDRKEDNEDNLYNRKRKRRELRTYGTSAEATLWLNLKNRQVGGYRFRRQYSVGPFILDFYCPDARLCVELDGSPHFTPAGAEADAHRTAYLETVHGIRVLRYENCVVFQNMGGVLDQILEVCRARAQMYPSAPAASDSPA